MVITWTDASYACLNYGEAYAPDEIAGKSICINDENFFQNKKEINNICRILN
jgi:hypothetical protein